jgi:hypothetical protein
MKFPFKKLGKSLKLNKMKYNLDPILYNRAILYFISFLAVVDIVYFISTNDFYSLLTFVLIGILTTFFSKNMIVILVVSLSITHVVKYGNAAYVSEGFKEGTDESNDETDESKEEEDESTKTPTSNNDHTKDSKDAKTTTSKSGSSKPPKSSTSASTTSTDKEYEDLKKEQKNFENIGKDIMENVKKIEPLLDKAEAFINKYEGYKERMISKKY